MNRRRALQALGLSAAALPFLGGCRDEEETQPGTEDANDDGLVDLLFVQEAKGVRFEGDKMTLVDTDPRTLFFADRPDELAGYLDFPEFIKLVSEGPDNFEEDPPNATLVIQQDNGLVNVVVSLPKKPLVEGQDLVFPSVKIIEGEPQDGGTSVLFIDTIGRPLTPVSVAGVHRRHRRRHRRRMRRIH